MSASLNGRAARPTRAEVNLDAVAGNYDVIRAITPGAKVFAVVKADAYGHGLVPVASHLERTGADGFCVALAEEGFALRRAGVRAPILVLNSAYGDEHAEVLQADLTPVVFDLKNARAFSRAARGRPFDVHVKVDTGMSRLGAPLDELEQLLHKFKDLPGLRIEGLMTHLSSADSDCEFTELQLSRFEQAQQIVARSGFQPMYFHAANSAGLLSFPQARFNLVRPGITLYGVSPIAGEQHRFTPAMRLVTEIVSVREAPAGAPIGYNQTFHTARDSRIATVLIGYGDALMRAASNRGFMLVRGKRCPIVGSVSMDLTGLDVTEAGECEIGDEAVLIGEQGGDRLTARDLADACRAIPYEVLTGVSPRVPRCYFSTAAGNPKPPHVRLAF